MGLLPKVGVPVAWFVVMAGCTWVGQQDYDDKAQCLDEDSDGFVADARCPELTAGQENDCDDERSERSPDEPELTDTSMWYDGIDQDCDGQDVVDRDGDGWPGILQADWTAAHPGINYPSGLQQSAVDCDDTVPSTYPGSASEVPYDGVDSNCDSKDDWDFDQDGQVPKDSLHGGVAYTGALPQTDCDDNNADIRVGTAVAEVAYDRTDQDCDGGLNDFDLDGDGHIADAHISNYDAFQTKYLYSERRTCTATDGTCNDCNDNPAFTQAGITGAMIHASATETWYDGVDQDCDSANDYDQDGDLFVVLGQEANAGLLGTGDCNDTAGGFDVNPGALELLADTFDQDCDGGNDTSTADFGGAMWTSPGRPSASGLGNRGFVVGATGETFEQPPNIDENSSAVGVIVAADRQFDEALVANSGSASVTDDFGYALAQMVRANNQYLQGRANYLDAATDQVTLTVELFYPFAGYQPVAVSTLTKTNLSGSPGAVDLQPGTSNNATNDNVGAQVWALACGDNYLLVTLSTMGLNQTIPTLTQNSGGSFGGVVGSACWIQPTGATAATVHAYGSGGYKQFTVNASTASAAVVEVTTPTHYSSTFLVNDVRHHNGLVIYAGRASSTTGISVYTDAGSQVGGAAYHTGETAATADAWQTSNGLYLAWTAGGAAKMSYGPATGTRTTVTMNLAYTEALSALTSAIYADDDTVLYGVSASGSTHDVVGWSFFGVAP